jgi:tetratricopeptide (TPR) repeat protein
MFVIARNSVFIYKNKPVKIKEISEEFGVQYVLEGSIERSADRLRVTSRLIDALTGNHMWVERIEYKMEDVFTIKDDITKRIITALAIEITDGEKARIFETQTENLEAIIQFSQGVRYYSNWENRKNTSKAQMHFEKAVELDPEFMGALALLASTHYVEFLMYWSPNRKDSFDKYVELVKKAISLDASSSFAHALQGELYRHRRKYDKAIAELDLALQIDPNNSEYHFSQGRNFQMAKQPEKAIEHIQKAMRLDPYFPDLFLVWLGQSLHSAGRYQEALEYYGEYSKRKDEAGETLPRWVYYCFIIAHLELGQIEKAYEYFEKASAMGGHYRYVGWAIQYMGYKNTDRERILKLFEPLNKIAAEIEIEKKKKVN